MAKAAMNKFNYLPSFLLNILLSTKEELYAWLLILSRNKILVILFVSALVILLVFFNPLPPSQVHLGTGQAGTSYRMLGEKFAAHFAKYGIELLLDDSKGLDDRLVKLDEESSPVSSAFFVATGDTSASRLITGVVSLGSLQFSPLWLFYRGDEMTSMDAWTQKRIAVGASGTSSQKIFKKLLELRGTPYNTNNFLELSYLDAQMKLAEGLIDGMFVVDTLDAPLIQSNLRIPDLHIYNYELADAYEKRVPFLSKLIVPRGALDLQSVFPSRDIALLSTTVTLLVEENLHSVIQWIFLDAARAISTERTDLFADPGYFPVYLDQSFPLSEVAARYYSNGLPFLARYLPLWLAVFIDSVWFWIIASAAVIVPVSGLLRASREYYYDSISKMVYRKLFDFDRRLLTANTRDEIETLLAEAETLEKNITNTWVSSENYKEHNDTVETIRGKIELIKAKHDEMVAISS